MTLGLSKPSQKFSLPCNFLIPVQERLEHIIGACNGKSNINTFFSVFFKHPAHPSRICEGQDLDLCLGAKKHVPYQKLVGGQKTKIFIFFENDFSSKFKSFVNFNQAGKYKPTKSYRS